MRRRLVFAIQIACVTALLLVLAEPPDTEVAACEWPAATVAPVRSWTTVVPVTTATLAAVSEAAATPTPTEGLTQAVPEVSMRPPLAGVASWYRYVAGHAAAGPALRAYLGPDWRGQAVTVCRDGRCVTVIVSDWCQCYEGTASERVIDLDDRSFAVLGPPGLGLVGVVITTP